jgi:long-subunit acyl-CoA synthetase (AMP-forming)
MVARAAGALAAAGVAKKERVGVYGANCSEWMVAMQVGGMRAAMA